ncbi:maleylacetoacetate isomerase (plasmid) [Pararhizobium polonicum]|uniref:Maleylacetoacetate isomerase n=1 Tax=Pararhizobium polonicum TaxID=1612624 RepID=A0A1C7P8S2_9HYPH|nr:maleylacetoacetate isomerase [Pararhizobium polonicum]OBZ97560.1 maleylacetoacetate isomerase [Pararhizobium polonicum]
MIIHGYFRSSSAYRLRIALNLKGLKANLASVHLRRGEQMSKEYRAINPQGLVPSLKVDGSTFTQSLAIIEYLDETRPDPPLLPADPSARAKVRAFAQIIACDIHPLQNLRVLSKLRKDFGATQDAVDDWCRQWIGDGLAACEALLEAQPAFDFTFGDRPSLADICLLPQLFSADRFGVDLSPFTRLRGIRRQCDQLSAFTDAHPSRQPDREE